jgi:hypothetical protein
MRIKAGGKYEKIDERLDVNINCDFHRFSSSTLSAHFDTQPQVEEAISS